MSDSKKFRNIFITIIYLVAVNILIGAIPTETVLAEYEGGTITKAELDARLDKIPPFYRPQYESPEGQEKLLNDLCTEQVFYLEAVARNVRSDDRYSIEIDNDIKSVYYNEYKKDYMDNNVQYTSAEKKAYFNEHPDFFVGKTYEEAEPEIEQKLRPEKERELLEKLKVELNKKYDIKLNEDAIMAFNLSAIDSNMVNKDDILVASNNPDIELSVGEFADKFEYLPQQNKAAIRNNEDLKRYLGNWSELEAFFYEAVAQGFEERESVKEVIEQIHRTMMLRTVYNQLVIDPIDMSDEGQEKFYNDNIELFSTNPYREVQTFGFDTEEEAKTRRKEVKKLIKKKDDEAINKLIADHSVYPTKDGILSHVYKNGIVPGIGKDEAYNDMIWKTKPNEKKLSKIFQNSKDIYVFFRILEDVKAVSTPYDSIKTKVQKQMMKDLSRKNFDDITAQLEKKYQIKKYPERLIVVLTAEEYFNKAESAQKRRKFEDAIFYYDKVIKHYPNNSDDYKATFMKGFLYAEEMKEKDKAISCFQDVLNKFPEGELHESAQFMIDELEGKSNLIDNFEESENNPEQIDNK
jgi:tetratricopeptide (TPR) repeat protein